MIFPERWKRGIILGGMVGIAMIVAVTIVYAWGSTGHRIINRRAARHLPASMSTYKADSIFYEQHASDADIRRNSDTATSIYTAEAPRHFLDIDEYPNFRSLPRSLETLIQMYGVSRVFNNGTNPWITTWLVDSLANQIRRNDRTKARQTMSDLGHYVGDAHQPLHCTENYDGWATGNGGIHSRYESTMLNTYQAEVTVHQDSVQYVSSPLDFAFEYIYQSQALVDSVMAADNYAKSVSGWSGTGSVPSQYASAYYSALWLKTKTFTVRQIQRATVDLASLWYTAWVNADLPTDVAEALANMPRETVLLQSYPNPFNPNTNIEYKVATTAYVSLKIFNLLGEEVTSLVDERKEPGSYVVQWNAGSFPGGLYFCRLETHGFVTTQKMLLLR